MNSSVEQLFLDYSVRRLRDMTHCVELCFARLTDEQVWRRGASHENAIGNLILHLCGNIRQWIMHGVANQPDVPTRDAEFSANGVLAKSELLDLFKATVAEADRVITSLPHERLTDRTNPQGRGEVSVLQAIYQVVGHVQEHGGQIILLTKQLAGQDLDLTIPRPR